MRSVGTLLFAGSHLLSAFLSSSTEAHSHSSGVALWSLPLLELVWRSRDCAWNGATVRSLAFGSATSLVQPQHVLIGLSDGRLVVLTPQSAAEALKLKPQDLDAPLIKLAL
jgi:hypothetical protein